ncbi:hypothetical protein HispidOSU_030903, partial [Sigmodon hispidus]
DLLLLELADPLFTGELSICLFLVIILNNQQPQSILERPSVDSSHSPETWATTISDLK